MSDVLIKGMKMPRCCEECLAESVEENYYGDIMSTECPFIYKGYTEEVRKTGRLEECPLVEVSSADVAEVRHGEWEVLESFSDPLDDSHKDRCRCTNCGFIHLFTDFHYGQYKFCPNCGAYLRKDGE